MKKPLFSVVVPTRNRARLLRWALQSALDQTFTDYEIVVSDNHSQDDTAAVARSMGGSALRYVRAPRVMSIADHWEFAYDQAQGEYVTFLCDDDAWHPQLLTRVADVIQQSEPTIIVPGTAVYFGDNWLDVDARNSVYFGRYTGHIEHRDSRSSLINLYRCANTYHAPRMLNSFCRRDLVPRLRQDSPVFLPSCQDYGFAAVSLSAVPEWVHIDEPLRLQGIFAEGIGSTAFFNRGEPLREYVKEFGSVPLLDRVPLQAPVVTNYIANTLLLAKSLLPQRLAEFDIDWASYFAGCWNDLETHARNGVDVKVDREEFFAALADQPAAVQQHIDALLQPTATLEPVAVAAGAPNPLKRLARKVVNQSASLRRLETAVRGVEPSSPKTLFGSRAGFNSILECARLLPDLSQARSE